MSFLLTSHLCEVSELGGAGSLLSGGFRGLLEPQHGRVHRNCAEEAGVFPAGRGEDVAVRVHIHILLLSQADLQNPGLFWTVPPLTGYRTRTRLQKSPLKLLNSEKITKYLKLSLQRI